MTKFYITTHALDRFREHHPEACWDNVREGLTRGMPASTERVRTLIGWGWSSDGDIYIVSADRRGVFVLAHGQTVVTYLRLNTESHRRCAERWPPRKAA